MNLDVFKAIISGEKTDLSDIARFLFTTLKGHHNQRSSKELSDVELVVITFAKLAKMNSTILNYINEQVPDDELSLKAKIQYLYTKESLECEYGTKKTYYDLQYAFRCPRSCQCVNNKKKQTRAATKAAKEEEQSTKQWICETETKVDLYEVVMNRDKFVAYCVGKTPTEVANGLAMNRVLLNFYLKKYGFAIPDEVVEA